MTVKTPAEVGSRRPPSGAVKEAETSGPENAAESGAREDNWLTE